MKKLLLSMLCTLAVSVTMMAQGWPANYRGVMLQGFYWDSFADTQWSNLESQADELSEFFRLVWIPQSGKSASEPSMGYNDLYWFSDYNSSFGNESQLRSMINTFKNKGIGTIADVVINHRSSLSGTWMSFPEEKYNGVTYTMLPSDICSNDDGGKAQANAEVKPTGAVDTGEDFDGARDLDHTSLNVQNMVKAYLGFLMNDLGYAGFRYDMVKGYAPTYTGLYNSQTNPEYSVGEYWDGYWPNLATWLNGTKVDGNIQSAAFDFALKYNLRDCCNAGTGWGDKLGGNYLACQSGYKRYAVTFVDNHDTFGRSNDSETTNNITAANAFILAAPGTPCVFLPHWKAYKENIKRMIYARNMAGIHNQSTTADLSKSTYQYAMKVNGADDHSVVVLMGSTAWPDGSTNEADYFLIDKGDNYAYYVSKDVESAWTDLPSGTYENVYEVTLNAISRSADARLVYTTNGTEPTASSAQAVPGAKITLPEGSTTLKVGMLVSGVVSGVITRNYTVKTFDPYDITVYVNVDQVGWNNVNFWTWGGDGSHSPLNSSWPGDNVTATQEIGGKKWYCKKYTINGSADYVSFVFSTGSGSPQTVDVVNVSTDKYFEISNTMSSGKYLCTDVTDQHTTGMADGVAADGKASASPVQVYAIDGRMVRSFPAGTSIGKALDTLPKGLYIIDNKKYAVR